MSVGFGRYSFDQVKHTITFNIDRSSVPNLDNTTVVRDYELKDDMLSWKVAPRKDGSVPITILKRSVDAKRKQILSILWLNTF